MKYFFVHKFFKRLYAVVCNHPVEMFLSILFCLFGFVLFETNDADLRTVLFYSPVCFLLAYTLNQLRANKLWRIAYFLSALLFVPFFWIREAPGTTFHLVSLLIVHLLYFVSDWRYNNDRFTGKVLGYLKALFSAGVLSVMAWVLSISIYFSVQYLFEIWKGSDSRFMGYSASVVFLYLFPLLFLLFNQEKEWNVSNRLLDVLFNYVLSPALVLYMGILYLYFIKIAILWSLPKGAVAYLVVSFVVAMFFLKGCQPFFGKKYYDVLYRNASLLTLPTLAMYWVGVFYRINEYGYTEDRVYLVAVGALLTGISLLFLSKQAGHYVYAAVLGMFCLSVVTYIPGITAKDIERISQTKRGNYPIREAAVLRTEFLTIEDYSPFDITGFATIQKVGRYDEGIISSLIQKDTFYLFDKERNVVFKEEKNALFARQLEKAGLAPSDSIPKRLYPVILRLDLDSALYVFGEISVTRKSPDSAYSVSYMGGGFYLKKDYLCPSITNSKYGNE